MDATKPVKQLEIIKIALLIAVLVTLPLTISLFRTTGFNKEIFSSELFVDLDLKFWFFFLFSWATLQFNTNWIYRIPKRKSLVVWVLRLSGNIGILVSTILLLDFIYPYLVDKDVSNREEDFQVFIFIVVLIIIIFISRILRLQIIQRQSILENEHLKQQNLQNELSALKNQINPHFLFNSLNSLNSLIRDNKEATMFVKKLPLCTAIYCRVGTGIWFH